MLLNKSVLSAVFRDWVFAGDYVEFMWLMLQQETPDNNDEISLIAFIALISHHPPC
jgi:hypothetical protein